MSLYEKVFGPSTEVDARPTVIGYKYRWTKQYSDKDIRKIHNDRTYTSVIVDPYDCDIGYASSVDGVHEAWLYPEGDILMCATTSEFVGTFASHDDIGVRYYHLVPNPEWKNTHNDYLGYNVMY